MRRWGIRDRPPPYQADGLRLPVRTLRAFLAGPEAAHGLRELQEPVLERQAGLGAAGQAEGEALSHLGEPVGEQEEKALSESKHTPGPWELELEPDGGFIITNGPASKDGTWVLAARGPIAHRAAVSHANARLIAAAPDLLAELQNIANADPSKWEPDVREQFREWAQNRARAAIRKAEAPRA
jgi:hypothetical protein